MRERHAIIRELAPRFQEAKSKKERSQILDQCVNVTGYTRWYAAYVLRFCGKPVVRLVKGRPVRFIPGHARDRGSARQRKRTYGQPELIEALTMLWALSDGLCGKRLVAFIREVLPQVEREGGLPKLVPTVREQLLKISSASVDRLLTKTRATVRLKGRSTTRPGTLLKHHIPVRTFADWKEDEPGFVEIDLVAHDGGVAYDDYAQTLDLTDIATGWTELRAVQNKAQRHVFAALQCLRARLPFPLLGIDSDNGSEFINHDLKRYCEAERITFTRSRQYRKNDNCFVEQKNYSVVRRTVGYYRYDTPDQLLLLNSFYDALSLFTNFFQPVMKLKEKIRVGSRVTRRYDEPLTPYQRVLEHPKTSQLTKESLKIRYSSLKLLELKRKLNLIQAQLFDSAFRRTLPVVRIGHPKPEHKWRKSTLHRKKETQPYARN